MLIIFLFFVTPPHAVPAEAPMLEKFLQMDLVGTGLIMGSVICYVLALQWGGQTHAWDSSIIIGLFVGFGTILVAFIFWEWFQGERAMIAPRLIRRRTIWVGSVFAFFVAGSYFVI